LALFEHLIQSAATALWGLPMLLFLAGLGIYFTVRLRAHQFRHLCVALKLAYRYRAGEGEGNISPLQSLMAALGGIIGNGNIAGVATAIAVGGPGSIFWLWLASLVAMIIVYVETKLGVSYRKKSTDGTYSGGPMYYIEHLLGWRWLAVLFALAMGFKTLLATATIQSNSIALAAQTSFGIPMPLACLVLSLLVWLVIIGGLRSIARTLEKLTPLMVLFYLAAGTGILLANATRFPAMLRFIVESAFRPSGAAGGFAGVTVLLAIRYGVARGFFSNEAGTGSAPIIYATARSTDAEKLSLVAMSGVVVDTIVATLTAFLILITGIWTTGQTSTALTTAAFATLYGPAGGYLVFLASFLFGYSSMVAWAFYGEQCFVYILGTRTRKIFRWLFCVIILFGFLQVETVWSIGDIMNGLIVLINGVAIFYLVKYLERPLLH